MKPPITSFRGQYHFLSNFYPCKIILGEWECPTLEHAIQMCKTLDRTERFAVLRAETPGQAKYKGGKNGVVTLRPDWEEVKLRLMAELLIQKFTVHEDLQAKLLATEDAQIIEGNDWGDRYWGSVNGIGLNHLGRLLMAVRTLLRECVPDSVAKTLHE